MGKRKELSRYLVYDFTCGMGRTIPFFAAATFLLLTAVHPFAQEGLSLSVQDILLWLSLGEPPYDPATNAPFQVPLLYMAFYLLILSAPLGYPQRDYSQSGGNVFLRTRHRALWWYSKQLWTVTVCTCFFLLLTLIALLFPFANQNGWHFALTQERAVLWLQEGPLPSMLRLWLSPLLVGLIWVQLQLLATLLLGPVLTYIGTLTLLVASAYFQTPLLLGNYAILIRTGQLLGNGDRELLVLALLFLAATAFTALCGGRTLTRRDILKNEDRASRLW